MNMFENAMRLGRTWFGVVLSGAGAAILMRGWSGGEWDSPKWIALAWVAAFAAGLIGAVVGVRVLDGERSLAPSLVWPSVGAGLILPLTLHLVVGLSLGADTRGFDEYVKWSVWFAGLAHVVTATLLGVRAYQLSTGRKALPIPIVVGGATIAGLIPLVVPALFVAVTGVPFVFVMKFQEMLAKRGQAEQVPVARVIAA